MKPQGKKMLFALILTAFFGYNSFAQQQVAEFLKFDLNDAQKLGDAYIQPFGKMFGNSLNGGWYQAARPHKLFGFDLTFTTVVSLPFPDEKTFDFNSLGLSNSIVLDEQSGNMSPSVTGKGNGVDVDYYVDGFEGPVDITLPKGANLLFTPMPFIQGSIGLPYHNELTVRFFPSVEIPKVGRMDMWGVGLKNEFKEFIPGLKMVPIDLSLMVGYTKFSSEFNVSYKPEADNINNNPEYPSLSEFNNQKLGLDANGITARVLVGKTIPILSVYAGLGYSYAKTDFGLTGLYPLSIDENGEPTNIVTANDPLVFNFAYNDFSANLGFRLRFGVIAFNFDYTLSKYPLFAAGFGISFR